MKLTARELELVADAPKRRQRRIRNAWVAFAGVIAPVIVVNGFDPFPWKFDSSTIGLGVSAVVVNLIHAYFGVRSDDRLVDLLQRYVNHDPEAIEQLGTRKDEARG
jgi:hypothetical protein